MDMVLDNINELFTICEPQPGEGSADDVEWRFQMGGGNGAVDNVESCS